MKKHLKTKKEHDFFTYTRDETTGAQYIWLKEHSGPSKVSGCVLIGEGIILDFNTRGECLGIELLK